MKTPLRLLAAALVFTLSAQAGEKFTIDPVHSSVGFKVKHLFSYVSGRFNDVSGTIEVDPAKPEASSVSVKIETKSINTANEKRDTHLRSPDFFDAEKFPQLTFTSKKVTRTGEDSADVLGDLTIHGVTKEVTLKVKFLGKGKGMTGALQTGWEAKTTIKRSEYGLVWNKVIEGTSLVGDDVEIELNIEAPQAGGGKA
jgi:polyisoprenoid-binding protein YceI